MMQGRDFTAMGEPINNTEYDIHAQNPELGELSAPSPAGVPPQMGHPAMAAGGGGEYAEYPSYAHATGGAPSPYGGHPAYAAAAQGFEPVNDADDGHDQTNDVEEELRGQGGGAGPEPAVYIDPGRLAQPLKLFVGQVPKSMVEEDLAFVFEPYGRILDLTVIRDRRSGSHRGCAFVTYENGEDAMKVVGDMHGKFKFEGAPWPAQIRPAAGEIDESSNKEDLDGKFGPLRALSQIPNPL